MKRRILSIFCALCLCLGLLPVTALAIDQAPSGSGTEEIPYQIRTADELFWFASLVNGTLEGVEQNTAACAVLTADIDLSGQTWTPIGTSTSTSNYFKGTFDGGGHTISNLTINTDASYVGLFGATSGATLKNVTLDEPQVQNSAGGTSNTGALVGYMVGNGTVEYCAVTNGSVSSAGKCVGGLIGYFLVGTVQYCYNYETTVSSTNDTPTYVNGVAGRAGTGEYLYSSFSYVSQQKGLKASNNAQYAAYLSETSTKRAYGINGGQYGFSADQFKDGTVAYFLRTGFYGGDAKYTDWGQTIGKDDLPKWKGEAVESLQYGRLGADGKAEDTYAYFNALTQGTDGTYHIEDTSDWIAFVKLVKVDEEYNANAVVNKDTVIDFSQFGTLTNKSTYSYLVIADCFSDEPYTGTFIGNGCTVKGVSYSGTMEFALFGTIGEGGSVSGITLEKPNITYTGNGTANIAGIASHNYGAIDDCHVDGGAISTEKSTAAGIAAESFGTVKNCTNSANITAKYQVAGIVATSNSTKGNTSSTKLMKIEGCSNSGTITATDEDYSYAGGIFGGKNRFSNDYPYGTISKCFNEGKILGQSYIGGIVGYSIKNANASAANVTIENCYNTGAIGDDRTTGVAGGISAGTNSSVTNCFNVGAVTGTNAQPIVANGYNTQAWSDNSYASCEVNGESFYLYYGEKTELKQDESGQLYYGNGKRTDAEMASGEVAYLLQQVQDDDEQVWSQRIGEDDHPVLVSNGEPAPVVLITVKLVDDGETATELTKCYTNAGSTLSAYPKPDDQGAVYTFYTDTSCTETNKIDTATKTYSTDTTIYVKQSKLPDLEGTVTIAGTPKTGEKLTAITNGITSENLGELRYQWYRCNGDDDSNPEAISEATSNTYTVTKADTGKYIKVVVTADNYSGSLSATTSQVQANPATVSTAPAAKDNLVYTGSAQALVTAGSAEGGTMQYSTDGSSYSADIPTGTGAGTYTVWYKVVGDDNHSDTQPVEVKVTIAKATPAYTVPTGLTATYGDTLADVTLTSGWTWDDAVTTSVGNVGENTFSATFTPSDTTNYNTVTENLTVTVSAKDISNAVITLGDSLTYTGQVQTQQIASVTVDGLTVTYTVTGNTGTGAGDYTLTITGTGNFTGTVTQEWSIAKATYTGITGVSGTVLANWPGEVTLPDVPAGASYGAASYDGSDGAVKDLSIEGGVLSYTGGESITVDQAYKITVQVDGGKNYEDYTITVTLTGSNKQTLTITGVTAQGGTYNGQTQAGYTGTPSAEGYDGGFTVTYNTADGEAPTNAGAYIVTIAIPEDDAQYVGSIVLEFAIAKKPLTVSAPSPSVYVGDSAPELALTYTGLVDGESVRPSDTPTFTITKSDNTEITLADAVKTAGTYTITWSNAGNTTFPDGANYAIQTETTGTLKVSNRSSGGTTTYPVQVEENSQNGGVQVSPKNAVPGTLVTVTPQPAPGYELATLTVLDQYGNEVDVNPLGNGNYSFKMPRSRVKVEATFYCTGSELCPTHHLADVLVKAWYHDAVDYVVEHGIMTGTSATTFEPNTTLSRAMVAQILYNLEGQPTVTGESTFTDSNTHWAAKAIAWAQKTGVVSGYGNNTFRPNQAVTREELAQMLYNYAEYKQYDLTASGDLIAFPDGNNVQGWAKTAMSWANGNQLINGFEDDTLRPGGDSTRAQAASILMNFDLNVVKD